MATIERVEMCEKWLKDHAYKVSEDEAWMVIQGAPGTGVARVKAGVLELKLVPEVREFVPERYWDIRMFGEKGEYHCWMTSDRTWRARFAKQHDDPDWTITTIRSYPLWGTQNKREGEWFRRSEERGTTVWIPAAAVPGLGDDDRTVLLNARLRIEADENGIAGIVDAMLCTFSIGGEDGKA